MRRLSDCFCSCDRWFCAPAGGDKTMHPSIILRSGVLPVHSRWMAARREKESDSSIETLSSRLQARGWVFYLMHALGVQGTWGHGANTWVKQGVAFVIVVTGGNWKRFSFLDRGIVLWRCAIALDGGWACKTLTTSMTRCRELDVWYIKYIHI